MIRIRSILLVVLLLSLLRPMTAAGELTATALNRTLEELQQIDGLTANGLHQLTPRIKALDYSAARALRILCRLPGITPNEIGTLLDAPEINALPYSVIPVLERYVALPGAHLAGAIDLMAQGRDMDFVSSQSLAALPSLAANTGEELALVLRRLKTLDESAVWTSRALLLVPAMTATRMLDLLDQLPLLSPDQQRTLETVVTSCALSPPFISIILPRIAGLTPINAINLAGLVLTEKPDENGLLFWLENFFPKNQAEQQTMFLQFAADRKKRILQGLQSQSFRLADRLNALHDVTDNLGRELSGTRLVKMTAAEQFSLLERLDPVSRERYRQPLARAISSGNGPQTAAVLQQATRSARHQLAEEMTTFNLYVLLANGGELFESSFREVVLPVFFRRLHSHFHRDLLEFLRQIDPDRLLVADFLAHLAWKGRLSAVFPADGRKQMEVISLMIDSALAGEDSLLFFSAAFGRMLQALTPPGRTVLIARVAERLEQSEGLRGRQLQVVLQHYRGQEAKLLGKEDIARIDAVIARRGMVDVAPYLATPFPQWLADQRLTSLSVFQPDDDGIRSFADACSYLMRHGYRPGPAGDFMEGLPAARAGFPTPGHNSTCPQLLQLARQQPLVIGWHKMLGRVTLLHAMAFSQQRTFQEQLLKSFLVGGHELFAQRGHSYWRTEQLLLPLTRLIERKEIGPELLTARPRFISIGSCGGIRAYLTLLQRFDNTIDLLATVGTGTMTVNTPFTVRLLELVAAAADNPQALNWQKVQQKTRDIFASGAGQEYLQPGSLPPILHKMAVDNAR